MGNSNNTNISNDGFPSMSNERSLYAVAAQRGRIFVVGGWRTATAEMFDVSTKKWTAISSMSAARENCAAVVFGDNIVVMGGDGAVNGEYYILSSAEQYNVTSRQWSPFPSMNKQRAGFAAAVVGGRIIVLGGSNGDGVLACGEEYDPDAGRWNEIPPMHSARDNCSAVVLDRKLYVMGGIDDESNYLSSAEVYNPTTRQWTMINDMTTPRIGHVAVSLGGRIIVAGGFDGDDEISSCEAYDPRTQKWSSIATIHTTCIYSAVVEFEDNIYILGGYDYDDLSLIEYLSLSTFFALLLDDKPDITKELGIDDKAIPTSLSFIGHNCKLLTMWKAIRNRQDLLTV